MKLSDFKMTNITSLVCTQPIEETIMGNNLIEKINEHTGYEVDIIYQDITDDKNCLAILAVYYDDKKEKLKISIQTEEIGNAKEALIAWLYLTDFDSKRTIKTLKKVLETYKDINFFAIFRSGETKNDILYDVTYLTDIEYGYKSKVVNVNTEDYMTKQFPVDKRALLILIAPLYELDKELHKSFVINQIINLISKNNINEEEAIKEVKMYMLNRLCRASVLYLMNDFCVKKMIETSL